MPKRLKPSENLQFQKVRIANLKDCYKFAVRYAI